MKKLSEVPQFTGNIKIRENNLETFKKMKVVSFEPKDNIKTGYREKPFKGEYALIDLFTKKNPVCIRFYQTKNRLGVAEVGDCWHKAPLKALTLNNWKMFIKCTPAPILATLC